MLDSVEQEDLVGIENLLMQGYIINARLGAANKVSLSDAFESIDANEAMAFGVITVPEEQNILKQKIEPEQIIIGL